MRGVDLSIYQNIWTRIIMHQYQYNASVCNYLVVSVTIFVDE